MVKPAAGPVIVSVPVVSLSSSWPELRVIVCGVAKAVGSKVIVVGTPLGVGVEDRLAERAGAAVVGVAHQEAGQEASVLHDLQAGAESEECRAEYSGNKLRRRR